MTIDETTAGNIELPMDISDAGSLELTMPKGKILRSVRLIPLHIVNSAPAKLRDQLQNRLFVMAEPAEGVANFASLSPGKYQVEAGGKSLIVEVSSGKRASVVLP